MHEKAVFPLRQTAKLLRYFKPKGHPLVYIYDKTITAVELNNGFHNGKS